MIDLIIAIAAGAACLVCIADLIRRTRAGIL